MQNQVNDNKKIDLVLQKKLLIQSKQGDKNARNELIISNMNLVHYRLKTKFKNLYDKEDFFQIGIEGLIKAVDNYDLKKENSFATYAITCIDNQILMQIRKESKHKKYTVVSIDKPISINLTKDMNEVSLLELLKADVDIEKNYLKEESIKELLQIIDKLNEKEKYIILNYYGFNNLEKKSQAEIATILGVNQAMISKNIKAIKNKIYKKMF